MFFNLVNAYQKIKLCFCFGCIFYFFINFQPLAGQQSKESGSMHLMFYNTENLFDTLDDPLKQDEEFTPGSDKKWNTYKYFKKLNNIYKVIAACGSWQPPDIIGLSEVENKKVLEDLTRKTPLLKYDYGIVHFESPDIRGIDVALLYNKSTFKVVTSYPIPVTIDDDPYFKTRDILYVQGVTNNSDTLSIFVNHWPSRRGGETKSSPKRIIAATTLRQKVDSIINKSPQANIIIVGDFNDDPQDISISEFLKAEDLISNPANSELYNLTGGLVDKLHYGSLKYKGNWNSFDQVIISGSLIRPSNSIQYQSNSCIYYYSDFIVQPDDIYAGFQPYRTYSGPAYKGGYSDHLPVVFTLTEK